MTRGAHLIVPLAIWLGACGVGSGGETAAGPPVDSLLVDALASVHLADARAAMDPDSAHRARLDDSLRAEVLTAHGLTPDALDTRLARLARDPEAAVALYDAVDARLTAERPQALPF